MLPIIKLENITKTYVMATKTLCAVHEVNLTVHRGEMLAIVGASGSGKSTLMQIMGLLDQWTSGQYFFSGEEVSCLPHQALAAFRNKKMGFVFQSFYLLPRLTALQNVMLPLFYRGIKKTEAQTKAMQMLSKVEMEKWHAHRPQQLSGGQQQRVAIARALVGQPEIIFADEPTGALDSKTSQEVINLFTHLNRQEGCTIVIITHDKEISHRCERMMTMKDGNLMTS